MNKKEQKLYDKFNHAWQAYEAAFTKVETNETGEVSPKKLNDLNSKYQEWIKAAENLNDEFFHPEAALVLAREYVYKCKEAYDLYYSFSEIDEELYYKTIKNLIPQIEALCLECEDSNSGEAYTILASIMEGAYFLPNEYTSRSIAFHFYRLADAAGNPGATMRLVNMLERWSNNPRVLEIQNNLLEKAIVRGNTEAMYFKALHLLDDSSSDSDKQIGFALVDKALEQIHMDPYAHMDVMNELLHMQGLCLFYGLGTDIDKELALNCIALCAPYSTEAAQWLRAYECGDVVSDYSFKPLEPLTGENLVQSYNPMQVFSNPEHVAEIHYSKNPYTWQDIIEGNLDRKNPMSPFYRDYKEN
jgi:TPR repeat protein